MDKSNFFKLPENERKQLLDYSEICIDDNGNIVKNGHRLRKYMEDLLPCAYVYLKNIEKDIKEKELPYVMSIEGGFGSGKTHFVTRLCQYLMDNGIEAIYFNAFEYDNTIDPKLAILDAISKKSGENSLLNKLCQTFETLKNSTSIDCMGASIGLAKLRLKDEIQKIKRALQNIIKESNKRLVLIIDELDRCDPRFCVDLLEVLKHFFDLDGLFTILSFSGKALLSALEHIYGSSFIKNSSENYLTKFIDHRTKIHGIDTDSYSKLALKFFRNCGYEKISRDRLNSISKVFYDEKLSLRETKRCVERMAGLIKSPYYKDDDHLSLYSYLVHRYDKDLDKIVTSTKYTYDPRRENQLSEKREKQFLEFFKICRESYNNNEIQDTCIALAEMFHIEHEVYLNFSCSGLREIIRDCYQFVCKDSVNAKILTEIFLSDLFEKINDTLKNTKQSRL